jgi:hypothetical protein
LAPYNFSVYFLINSKILFDTIDKDNLTGNVLGIPIIHETSTRSNFNERDSVENPNLEPSGACPLTWRLYLLGGIV